MTCYVLNISPTQTIFLRSNGSHHPDKPCQPQSCAFCLQITYCYRTVLSLVYGMQLCFPITDGDCECLYVYVLFLYIMLWLNVDAAVHRCRQVTYLMEHQELMPLCPQQTALGLWMEELITATLSTSDGKCESILYLRVCRMVCVEGQPVSLALFIHCVSAI